MRPQAEKIPPVFVKPCVEGLQFLEPLLTLSRIVGIFPTTRSDKISFADYARIIFSLTIFIAGQIIAFIALMDVAGFQNSMNQCGFIVSYTTPSLVFCSQLFLYWRNSKFFSTVFSRLVVYKIDGSFFYYPNIWTIIGLGFPPFVFLADMCVMAPPDYVQRVALVLHALGYSASLFPVLIFGSILEVLDTRVDQLTLSLKFRTTPSLLLAVCDELDDLKKMTRKLSWFFGPTILICFAFFFVDLIWCCYFAVILLFDDGPYHKIVLYEMGAVYNLFGFFLMSKACEDHYKRIREFHWEMYDLMCSSELLCKHEKLKLFVSLEKTVEFSCCGFFTIGYTLVSSIIAAATTYLVILIQFSIQND